MTVRRTETVEVVRALVAQLNATANVTSIITISAGIYKLLLNDTYHLQPTFKITIGVVEYKITEVVQNVSITLTGASIPVIPDLTVSIAAPKYYHGTVIDATNQLAGVTRISLITPMVYCYEPIRQRIFNRDSPVDREVELRLYFLTQANFKDWKVQDFLDQARKQMMSLVYRFIEEICNNSPLIGDVEEYEIIETNRMCVKSNDKENKNLFNKTLSGVEMTVTLPIMRQQC